MTAWSLLVPAMVAALPPAPANDDPLLPEVIGPDVPVLVYGTTVLADDSINTTLPDLPAIDPYVDGPDVFYSFTPNVTDAYRVKLIPWHRAPLRSSDRRFTIYIQDSSDVFLAGARAPGNARPVHFDVALTSGETYRIGVDHNAQTYDNFPFTLIVDALSLANPDDCASAVTLPTTLPIVVLNDIDRAAADFLFAQSADRCAVSGTTPTTAPGIDHVYHFNPPADGDYAIELVANGFNGVLYVDESCGPFFPDGCLGASDHSTSGSSGGRHELVVVTLEAGKDYWVFVDNGSTTINTGSYALIIDDAFDYEINEIEPNDTPAGAAPLATPLTGGQLVGPQDTDYWAVTGLTGDRVYCWVNNGGSSNSTLDTELRFYKPDGVSLIEYDDDDGDGINSPINDLRYVYSTTASVIAGARMVADATHYLHVRDDDTAGTRTIHRYRFHVGVEPASRTPLAECEPNDTLASADRTGKNYFSGAIPTTDDLDVYAFDVTVGDRVFVAFDGDPERDATGSDSANTDPNAFHGKLIVYDPLGDVLISDVSDSNTAQTGGGDYPAQAAYFVARRTGTYYVQVGPQSSSSQVGPTETYELAIFLNNAAPALSEDVDPVIEATPDHPNDLIDVLATDNEIGDSGICEVELIDADNVQLTGLSFTPGDASVSFQVTLINSIQSGRGKLLVTDCAGNTACRIVLIDVNSPTCDGVTVSTRAPRSLHDPIHVPDNQPSGPGIDGTIDIGESGSITDVNVTITIETIRPPDIDAFLISPTGTSVELITDRGSSLAFDITDATFDDDADEIMPILSGDAPYTGTWLPEDPQGLAKLNGEDAQGTWRLNVRDDSSSAGGGARLARWSLDVMAAFSGPHMFVGTAADTQGFDSGIESIVLTSASNAQLELPPDFVPGDQVVAFSVTLIDSSQNGSGTVTVTDMSQNTCVQNVSLNGFPDNTGPDNSGGVTTDLTVGAEVQADVPPADPAGVTSSFIVPDSILVGEVEADLTIDTKDVGRLASTLAHDGEFASLINRVGMDERASVGLTKDNIEITLDDDAPEADDAHLEPALGSIEFLGLHQPDGRGEFIGDGITADKRDNMLLRLEGLDSAGQWDLFVGDFRQIISGSVRSTFRRWSAIVKSPCGPERYVGTATDFAPQTGICSIAPAPGAVNLVVDASFSPGDELVEYVVSLVDPSLAGSGTLEITDCNANTTTVPISLAPTADDDNLPIVGGSVNPVTHEFEGFATDNQSGDSGIASVEPAPFSDNLQIVSVTPDPPNGAPSVSFVVALVDPLANGRGYVRVTDGCGWRSHVLVEIDAQAPVCTGSAGDTKRYLSGDLPAAIPDNDQLGVLSSIVVADTDAIDDVNITLNVTHAFDDDIDLSLVSPVFVALFTDIGSTGNDFIDTTLDDEAPAPIPDTSSEAPFTGSYQPEGGPALLALDGSTADGTYTLRVVDDKTNDTGTFESWSLTIESATFPERFDGRAEDGETHASGICTVELLAGAVNLTLNADPFAPGDHIVRYSVDLANPDLNGVGTVRVSDCAGNSCDVPVVLVSDLTTCVCADLDTSGGPVDLSDFIIFASCFGLAAPGGSCTAEQLLCSDMNVDGVVDLRDFVTFASLFSLASTQSPPDCLAR